MEAPFSSCSDQRHCCIFKTLLFPLLLWSSLRFSWLYSQNKSGICPALSHLCYSLLGPNTLIFQLRYGNGLLTGPPASAAFRTTPLPVSFQEGRWRYVVPGISLCESHCLSPMPKPLQGLLSLRVKAKLKFSSWCSLNWSSPPERVRAHTALVSFSAAAFHLPLLFLEPTRHARFFHTAFSVAVPSVLEIPRWLSGKESTCKCRKGGRCRLIPGSERFPGRQDGIPLQWKIPQIKEPGRVQSTECQRVGQVWALEALPIEAHIASSLMFFSLFSGVITFQCDFPWPPYLKLKTLQPRHISYLPSLCFFFFFLLSTYQ